MEIKKADSKGRVTVGQDGVNYYVDTRGDGSIVLKPVPEYKGLRIIEMKPGEGKTTTLVKIMLEPGNEDVLYVAPTNSQARIGYLTALELLGKPFDRDEGRGAKITEPELWKRFMSYETHAHRTDQPRVVVDELDGVIGRALNATVLAVSGTDSVNKAKWRADRYGS